MIKTCNWSYNWSEKFLCKSVDYYFSTSKGAGDPARCNKWCKDKNGGTNQTKWR